MGSSPIGMRLVERGKAHRSLSTHGGNAAELRMQLFALAPASGEMVGVRGLSERIVPYPNPLPEGEGNASRLFPR